jgi:hypothetical protein
VSHSPGPWRWAGDGLFSESAGWLGVEHPHEEISEADAALIAAAPELLAMLRELEWGGESEHWQGVSACLFCRGDEPGERHPGGEAGHKPDCRLSALLRRCEP